MLLVIIIAVTVIWYGMAIKLANTVPDINDAINKLVTGGLVATAALAFIYIIAIFGVFEYQGVDKKIEVYKTQNQQLERKIDTVVKNYMDHEKDTYKEFKAGDGMTLIATYPELRSNELVKKQVETYEKNNRKITKLEEDEIDYNVIKWWLYFGGRR